MTFSLNNLKVALLRPFSLLTHPLHFGLLFVSQIHGFGKAPSSLHADEPKGIVLELAHVSSRYTVCCFRHKTQKG